MEQQFCQDSGQGQQPRAKLAPAPSNSVAQARLREALTAGGPGTKEKGPPVADGFLSVTPDTPEAIEFRSRRSIFDSVGASSSYLEDETGMGLRWPETVSVVGSGSLVEQRLLTSSRRPQAFRTLRKVYLEN